LRSRFSGIFEKHKLLFSFQIAIKLEHSEEKLSQAKIDFFIKGNVSLEKSLEEKPEEWIPDHVCL
jgi:dynein heavy chain